MMNIELHKMKHKIIFSNIRVIPVTKVLKLRPQHAFYSSGKKSPNKELKIMGLHDLRLSEAASRTSCILVPLNILDNDMAPSYTAPNFLQY